jgi:2-dehydropantoate 2-reductase
VVSLQNGVDNEEKIADRIGPEHVLGGAAFIFASVVEPGVVHDAGGPGSLLFGELDGARSGRGEALLAVCEKAGIPAEFVTDIRVRLWDKFAFICAQAGMTACTRLPIGDIRAVPVTWAMFRRIVDEVIALGTAEGVDPRAKPARRSPVSPRHSRPGAFRLSTTTSSAVGAWSSRRCTVSWSSDPAPTACRRR